MDRSFICSEPEAKIIREILTYFYPASPPTTINQGAVLLACRMFAEISERSGSMAAAPRRDAVKQGFLHPALPAVMIAWRQRFRMNRGVYENLRLMLALTHRFEYEQTQEGAEV